MNLPEPPKADGYTTEIAYLPGYYRDLNPLVQTLVLNAMGVDTWRRGTPMTYLELGCGYGLSTLVHAAANPQATFVAIDILPDHIMTARALAEAAGLKNVTFIEGSFAALKDMALPKCDFIVMHGVWSWINDTNREYILRCVDACLKPGGVLSLSYNALPGCATVPPLRELMVTQFSGASGSLPERMTAALTLTDAVKSLGGGFFANNPMASRRFEDLRERPRNYLAHEYFNTDWTAFYHSDVAAAFGALDLTFVSLATVFETIDELHFSPNAFRFLSKINEPTLHETLKDFMVNRQFRVDLFVRGPIPTGNAQALCADTRFAAVAQPNDLDRFKRRTTTGEVNVAHDLSRAIVTVLSQGPTNITALAQHPLLKNWPSQKIAGTVYVLAGLGAIEAALPAECEDASRAAIRRLNGAIRQRNVGGPWTEMNASTITGGGVQTSREDQIFFLAQADGVDPVQFAARVLGESEVTISERYRHFIDVRMPIYIATGVD